MTEYKKTQPSFQFQSTRSPRTTQQGRQSQPSSQISSLSKYDELKSQQDCAVLLQNYKQLKMRDLRQELICNYLSEAKQQTLNDSCEHYFPKKPVVIPKQESFEARRTMPVPPAHSLTAKLQQQLMSRSQRKARMCFEVNNGPLFIRENPST